ncbi:hypothetical protein P7L64_08970 [Tistrella bauzanensis]|uniref:hypothetical protein n=1 Tax=Tistrella bauzanensis TaxID=657419 RepID=UPI0016659053|nr:hypothetical protein [Tistrella bauzanensis]
MLFIARGCVAGQGCGQLHCSARSWPHRKVSDWQYLVLLPGSASIETIVHAQNHGVDRLLDGEYNVIGNKNHDPRALIGALLMKADLDAQVQSTIVLKNAPKIFLKHMMCAVWLSF